jgi:serine/threonine protein phosphatase PrpC
MLTLRTSTASRTGTARTTNQDRVGARARRVVLADGMGGRRGGETAAAMAVESVLARPAGAATPLRESVHEANRRILAHARAHDQQGMGTTVVAVDLPDPTSPNVVVGWVGDSRAYRVRGDQAWQVTGDHTWEAMLLELGAHPDEASRRRHVLTRAVGTQPDVEVDLCTFEAQTGDRLVLCSDGVHGVLEPGEIARLATRPDPAAAIVDAAVAAGSRDDTTVAVVSVVPVTVDEPTGPIPVLVDA